LGKRVESIKGTKSDAHNRLMAFRLLLRLWALPCTLVGWMAALVLVLLGAHGRVVEGVLEIALPMRWSSTRRWPFAALTLGHVVIGVSEAELARLRAHEQAHVRQFERWGPLFPLLYALASVASWWRGEGLYAGNRFEQEARRAEVNARIAPQA
jgi:hypothetical protein